MFNIALALLSGLGCSVGYDNLNRIYPSAVVTPDEIEFYDVERDQPGVVVGEFGTQTVSILNAGRAPLEISDIRLASSDNAYSLSVPAVEELLSDEQLVVTVRFEPPNYLPYTNTLIIETNDPEHEDGIQVPLFGDGVDAPRPCIELSPLSLDFGEVAPGVAELLWFEIENCGEGALTITGSSLSGSDAFSLVSGDPTGSVLDPSGNDIVTVNVLYDPNKSDGDTGTVTITSDDPENPEVEVLLIGNGGGGDVYPVAVIDCPSETAPLDNLALDGTGSYDPSERPIERYEWSLEDRPRGSRSELVAFETDTANLFMDSAGEYLVTLVVTNDIGVRSDPARCLMDAIPEDFIHVELTWNTSDSDLDLHMANEVPTTQGENFFREPDDVNFCYPQANWGSTLTDIDDARLDLDNLVGYGPENINIPEPADGEYLVRVHYFTSASNDSTTATLRFYLRGVEVATYERVMEYNEVWDVAVIDWPDETLDELADASYEAPTRACYRD